MTGYTLYISNRLETLSQSLADVIREKPPANPLAEEVIIVQGNGMERWVSMQLAEHTGICATIWFYYIFEYPSLLRWGKNAEEGLGKTTCPPKYKTDIIQL